MLRSKRRHQETTLKFDAVALDILKDVDLLFTKILVKNFTNNFVTKNFVYRYVFDIQIDIIKILTILSNTEQL